MKKWNVDSSWTLFLDRDGVINERKMGGYIQSVEEFKFLPKVVSTIAELSRYFKHVFVVTNQQGVGKGIMTECNVLEIHDYMVEAIENVGGSITSCYFAPELRTARSDMRKPNSGMALKAKEEYPEVDFSKSIMVGDSDSDILFGTNLGMKTVRIKTIEPIRVESDLTLNGLRELIEFIKL